MNIKAILTLLLCMALAGSIQAQSGIPDECEQYLPPDLDRNYYVDIGDLAIFALNWLEQDCGLANPCGGADMSYYEGEVDLGDFKTLAEHWGECTDVTNPACIHEPLTLYEPPTASISDEGVQLFSGEFTKSVVDMRIGGRGIDFVWKRTYRSRTGPDTEMGIRWDYSYNIYLSQCGSNLLLHDGDGRRDLYYPQDDGTWVADGFQRVLEQEEDDSFTMTFEDKGTWKLNSLDEADAPGKINAITDRNDNSIEFVYDTNGLLTTITDALYREITFIYNDSNNISSISADWASLTVTYEHYDVADPNGSEGDLKSVSVPDKGTTTYTYSTGLGEEEQNHNLLTITDGKGQTYLQNTYSGNSKVIQQTLAGSNNSINTTYAAVVPDLSNNFAVAKTITNDRMGNVTEHFFGNRNQLLILRRYTGRAADPDLPTTDAVNRPIGKLRGGDPDYFETSYQYNSDYLPTRIDYHNGNYIENVYEADIDPDASARTRGNLREMRRHAGALGGDQTQIDESFEYDSNFNLITRHIDPRGNETVYDYDSNGNRIRTTNVIPGPDPNIVSEWQYNGSGQVIEHILPDNGSGSRRRDEYTYHTDPVDPNYGYLQNVIIDANNLALTTTYEYDAVGNVTRITDPNGQDTQFIYNQLNQVVRRISREVTDGSDVRYKKEMYYDENSNVIRVDIKDIDDHGILQPDPNITTIYEYDLLDRLIRTTAQVDDSNSVVTEYEYDDNSNLTLTRSGEAANGNQPNNVVRTLYDERDLIFQVIRAESDPKKSTTQYDYDGNANVISVHEGLEDIPRTTTSQYDGYDRLIQTDDPMGNVTEFHYDPTGNVTSKRIDGELTDVDGDAGNIRLYETSYEYDSLGRLTHSTVAFFDPNTQSPIDDGNVITEYQYSNNSQVIQSTDDNANQTHYEYDTLNRKKRVTDAKNNKKSYAYDKKSNVISVTEVEESDLSEPNEIFVTTYAYDNLDRLIRVTDNNNNTTEYGYDSRSNRKRVTDALGNETRYEYDYRDRLTQTIRDMDSDGADAGDADDIKTSRTYDDNSRLRKRKDDRGNTTTHLYDALNRRTETTYADGTSETSTYDVHDDMVGSVDAAGTVSVRTYDKKHRLTRGRYTPGTEVSNDPNFEDYQYDGLSRMVYAENNNSVVTMVYDSLSNVVSETLNGETTASTHDGLGNKLSCTYPGGRVVTNTYDALNRKKTTSSGGTQIGSYDYIGRKRVRRLSYGNSTKCDYSYDNLRRITSTEHLDTIGGFVIDDRIYAWDAMGNKTQREDVRLLGPLLTHDYTYDDIYRLVNTAVTDIVPTTVRNTAYALDSVGNRTGVTGSPDAGAYTMDGTTPIPADDQMNQYTTTPFDERTYNDNGNIRSSAASAASPPVLYTFDAFDQLVDSNDTDPDSGIVTTYSYDAMKRRTKKETSGGSSAPTETRYFYDGARVIEEQDGNGTTLATYVYGNYIDEVLSMDRSGTDYYYHTDDMYNVMAVTNSARTVVERYEYGDYGEPDFVLTTAGVNNPYLFNGRRYDPETGLYYYRTRYLDPKAGRFVSRDTIGNWGDGSNLGNGSAYVGNNPWSNLDPFGIEDVFKVVDESAKDDDVNLGGVGPGGGSGVTATGYCVKCKAKKEMQKLGGGGGTILGKTICPDCGTGMFRILGKAIIGGGGPGGGGGMMLANFNSSRSNKSSNISGSGGGGNSTLRTVKFKVGTSLAKKVNMGPGGGGGGGGGGVTATGYAVKCKAKKEMQNIGGGGAIEEIWIAVEQISRGISGGGGGGGGGISIMMNKAQLIEAIARSTGGHVTLIKRFRPGHVTLIKRSSGGHVTLIK